jgi:hypothetical protein
MKKKLPVVPARTQSPAEEQAARSLAVAPVRADQASRPEFPRKRELRTGTALLGGAMMMAAGGLAHAKAPAAKVNPGSIDGNPLPKKAPRIKMHREGGGIGPAQVVWEPEDVEAFLNWKFAHDGHLDIKTAYSLDLGDGMKVTLDGFDPKTNIGYEYVYGDDDSEFTDDAVKRLDQWMKDKKAAVLVIDMSGTPDESTLSRKVTKFLAQVKKHPPTVAGDAAQPAEPPMPEHPSPKAC